MRYEYLGCANNKIPLPERLFTMEIRILQPPQPQQAPLQIQSSIISQQAVAAAAAAAQQQYAAVPVSMVETGRQMLLTVS